MDGIDYTRLTPELLQKLERIEANKPINRQLRVLEDIADVFDTVASTIDGMDQSSTKMAEDLQQSLKEIQAELKAIGAKEMPEAKDQATPVVDALKSVDASLSKALKSIELQPKINVAAPNVDVQAPEVDLTDISKALRKDIPAAFQKAIQAIPKTEVPTTDLEPVVAKLDELRDWLESIDNASRLKPQFPNVMKVTNQDGSVVGQAITTSRYDLVDPVYYVGTAPVGAPEGDNLWTITKYDLTTNPYTGLVAINTNWTGRAGATYE